MSKIMGIVPRVSEKAYQMSQTSHVYVFEVPADLNKMQVKAAVEAQFSVNVINVNTTNVDGKVKRAYRKRGRSVNGKRPDIKKAYVTIQKDQEIPIFVTEEKESKSTAPKTTTRNKKGAKA